MSALPQPGPPPIEAARARSGLAYWLLASAVTAYVALATGFRDEVAGADAWEHHRAVRVMAALGGHPGNPTYATDDPSIRFSPYTAALAAVVRATGLDAWDVLSGAAVLNTALLAIALALLLRAFGRPGSAFAVLVVALLLYGATPGYANTLALADLPWHQVNPSAFALVVALLAWAAWRWAAPDLARVLAVAPLAAFAVAIALLSHAMTGALAVVGLAAVSACERGAPRWRALAATGAVTGAAVGLAALWPCYPFVAALRDNPEPTYWYNPAVLKLMLTRWCVPAAVAGLLAIPRRDEPLVRFGLSGVAATAGLTALAVATRSATLARLPLAGLVFSQLLAGDVLASWRLDRADTWRAIGTSLRARTVDAFLPGFVRLALPLLVLFFAGPQLVDVVHEPHLLRPRIAGWLHRPDRRSDRLANYRRALQQVGERDVVMASPAVAWPVPSVSGRIVAAEHFEFFVPDQARRREDALRFMAPGTPRSSREALVARYGVRWILVDLEADSAVARELAPADAVARTSGPLVLVDVRRWLAGAEGGEWTGESDGARAARSPARR